MVDKKKYTLKKQKLNGGGLGSSKQKQPDVIDNAIENKTTKPNNKVRFTSDVRTRSSYDDEYGISNISEEEPVSDNYKTKSKNRKKQWSKKRVNNSKRSVDINNRRTLNQLKINMDHENHMNFVTGKITREEYDEKEKEIAKQVAIGGKKRYKRKSKRHRKSKHMRNKSKKSNRI